MSNKQTLITKNAAQKELIVERDFDAPPEEVWKYWTKNELLDQWWAPKPWKAKTKAMDFKEGGCWHYSMVGPDGSEAWCREDYLQINQNKSFTAIDSFCDEHGSKTGEMPVMHWRNLFSPTGTGTKVEVIITFDSEEEMEKIIEMGFEQGFTMAHGNLDELLDYTNKKL